jgi:hypothetical protein
MGVAPAHGWRAAPQQEVARIHRRLMRHFFAQTVARSGVDLEKSDAFA